MRLQHLYILILCYNVPALAAEMPWPLPTAAEYSQEPVLPLPQMIETDARKVQLGQRLFEDKQLSKDASMACRSCHYIEKGGADNLQLSATIGGGHRSTNTPSIYNLGFYELYGWYGNRTSLAELTAAIITSNQGMASDWPRITAYLAQDHTYIANFNALYRDGIQPDNILDALTEYMRSLITPDSRFDQYLRGNSDSLTDNEKKGYQLFKDYGCTSCHQGHTLGANMRAPFNIFRDHMQYDNVQTEYDLGRYNKTGDEADKYVFRVPSLRNVALTAPYFHDGSSETLDGAVDVMGRYMLGRRIASDDRRLIVDFLQTLTGQYLGKPL